MTIILAGTGAHRCVKIALTLSKTELGTHIRKQLIRCATSVAANYHATLLSQTKAAFISKTSIVIEESDESGFWLEFVIDENLMQKKKRVLPLSNEAYELTSIFVITVKPLKKENQSTIDNQKS